MRGAGDPLFQPGGIPGEVTIDDHAGILKIESRGAESAPEKPGSPDRSLKGVDLAAPFLLRHAAGVPRKTDILPLAQFPDQHEHALPFGEYNHLGIVGHAVVEDFLQFAQFRAGAIIFVQDVIRVDKSCASLPIRAQPFLFLLPERTALRRACEFHHLLLVAGIGFPLQFGERDKMIAVRALRQFRFHFGFAPPQHERLDAGCAGTLRLRQAAGRPRSSSS